MEAREPWLYQQLAGRDAIHESQRRIYMERFRALEDRIQQKGQEIFALRARLGPTVTMIRHVLAVAAFGFLASPSARPRVTSARCSGQERRSTAQRIRTS
jgi:hypothetical protein